MREESSFYGSFGPVQLDVLKEIGNIGAGHAATSLSKLLNKKIEMHVPGVEVVDFDGVMELAGGADKEVVSIYQRIGGDTPGGIFFVLTPLHADRFVQRMTRISQGEIRTEDDPEMSLSALQELGNILSGAYLTALGDFTKLDFSPTVPVLAQDLVGAILSVGLIELSQVSDQAIVIKTSFMEGEGHQKDFIEAQFFLFPDPASYKKIFSAMGVLHEG
jgi:chemotaxis protein CheC